MSLTPRKITFYYLPVVFWLAVIYIASSISSMPNLGDSPFHFDKIAHFLEFAVFGFLLVRAIYHTAYTLDWKLSYVVTLGIALFVAAFDEFHQLYVPDRTASAADFMADCAGVVFAVILFDIYRRKSEAK